METMFKLKWLWTLVLLLCLGFAAGASAAHKIFYVDSYHEGYPWSDGITRGIQSVFDEQDVTLKIFRMDTKRNKDAVFIKNAAQEAKQIIETYQPDIVIVSDDNASRYLIAPFYKNRKLPVVFCGINWNASIYGYPYENATGMVEVASVGQLVQALSPYAKGNKVGYLAANVLTARKEGMFYRKKLGYNPDKKFVIGMSQWIQEYIDFQTRCDILIVGNHSGINDWDDARALKTVMEKTVIPTGSLYDFMTPYAMITYAKSAEEQGRWAAETALKVLGGADIRRIPVTENKQDSLIINRKIEKTAGFKLKDDLVKAADAVIE